MKITDVKAYLTAPHGAPFLFVEVYTDEGVTGVGEATLAQANQLLFRGVDAIRPLVVGLDPSNIEEIWQRIFRRFLRIGPRGVVTCLLSAVDIALWDIKGKVLGVPVYQLLGGPVRECVPLYTHVQDATSGISLDEVHGQALRARADGYEALKTDPFAWARNRTGPFQGASLLEWLTPGMIARAIEWIEAIRDAVDQIITRILDEVLPDRDRVSDPAPATAQEETVATTPQPQQPAAPPAEPAPAAPVVRGVDDAAVTDEKAWTPGGASQPSQAPIDHEHKR